MIEKLYREYLARYASGRGITEEEAEKHAIVKEYREWLEKEHK